MALPLLMKLTGNQSDDFSLQALKDLYTVCFRETDVTSERSFMPPICHNHLRLLAHDSVSLMNNLKKDVLLNQLTAV